MVRNIRLTCEGQKMMKARFTCNTKIPNQFRAGSVVVAFHAAYDESNKEWAEATPSGSLSMVIDNPAAAEFIEQGQTYELTFVRV